MTKLLNQPKGVFLLLFIEMCYGMRALLVLFMTKALGLTDAHAFGIYAVFCALVELGGVLGAYLAEKILGLQRAITYGGWLIALGHISLAMKWFLPGLSFLIIGSSLLTINTSALVGNFYEVGDEKRASGFALYYQAINIGLFFTAVLCGWVAEHFGWPYSFGTAACGMLLGNLALIKYKRLLKGNGEPPPHATRSKQLLIIPILCLAGVGASLLLMAQNYTLPFLPWIAVGAYVLILRSLLKNKTISKKALGHLAIYLAATILFFVAHEQIGSSLILFGDRLQHRTFLGLTLPSTFILGVNPIAIFFFGSLVNYLYRRLKVPFFSLFIPFALIAIAFSSIMFTPHISFAGLLLIVAVVSFAELFIVPIAYSECSNISKQANDPKVMALMPIGFSVAATLGGSMSKLIAHSGYTYGFLVLGLLMLASGFGLGAILSRLKEKQPQRESSQL